MLLSNEEQKRQSSKFAYLLVQTQWVASKNFVDLRGHLRGQIW